LRLWSLIAVFAIRYLAMCLGVGYWCCTFQFLPVWSGFFERNKNSFKITLVWHLTLQRWLLWCSGHGKVPGRRVVWMRPAGIIWAWTGSGQTCSVSTWKTSWKHICRRKTSWCPDLHCFNYVLLNRLAFY
jgi:hypothetical protein